MDIFLPVTSVCLYSTKTCSKCQDHLKVKVKFTQYQGQGKGNQFSVYLCLFCDLCATHMVRLRLIVIRVLNMTETQNGSYLVTFFFCSST